MDKTYSLLDKVNNYIVEQLITKDFLTLIQKWARYTGEDFYIGDMDFYITNLGQWTSKEGILYDITLLNDACTTANESMFIIMSAVEPSIIGELKQHIYWVKSNEEEEEEDNYFIIPTIDQLKNDIETGRAQYSYRSLIRSDFLGYHLQKFNDSSDRLTAYSILTSNLECLENNFEYEGIVFPKVKLHPVGVSRQEIKNRLTNLGDFFESMDKQ